MSSYSGDAAEQVVRMSLEGAEVAVKLAGTGAKQLAILLYAMLILGLLAPLLYLSSPASIQPVV